MPLPVAHFQASRLVGCMLISNYAPVAPVARLIAANLHTGCPSQVWPPAGPAPVGCGSGGARLPAMDGSPRSGGRDAAAGQGRTRRNRPHPRKPCGPLRGGRVQHRCQRRWRRKRWPWASSRQRQSHRAMTCHAVLPALWLRAAGRSASLSTAHARRAARVCVGSVQQ